MLFFITLNLFKTTLIYVAVFREDYRSFSTHNDGTLPGLAKALKLSGNGISTLSDNNLFSILNVNFARNWFKMKACLTTDRWPTVDSPPSHEASIELMQAMVNMRGRVEWICCRCPTWYYCKSRKF